jgi:predicted ATPase
MPPLSLDSKFFSHDAQAGGFFPVTHINPGFDINSFIRGPGKNMLIEGIRGTGKTHMLKMIASKCIDCYSEEKILPVYVSLSSLSEWYDVDLPLFRIHLYANIVNETILTIERDKDKIQFQSKGIEKALRMIKSMFGINSKDDINEILKKIRYINEKLLSDLTYNKEMIRGKITQEVETTAKLGSTAKCDVGQAGIKGSLSCDAALQNKEKSIEEQEIEYMGKTLAYENASLFIIEFFKQLKEILGSKYVLLLLDECSEPTSEAQIEIFRLLKLIRGSASGMEMNYVYFYASVYPPYATKYPSKIHGNPFDFEPGNDADVEYLQLDELTEEYEKFFIELTRKRLEFVLGRDIPTPINEIFETESAFILAAYAANGIPRRYLQILKQGYDNLWQRADPSSSSRRISLRDIESAIQIIASNQILTQHRLQDKDLMIIDELIQRIGKRNRKTETENKGKEAPLPSNVYFTIARMQFKELNNLLLQGCVHDKGRTRQKKYYRETGSTGPLLMLDLAIAYQSGAINRARAPSIFKTDLKDNAKAGYKYCHDFNLDEFEYKYII